MAWWETISFALKKKGNVRIIDMHLFPAKLYAADQQVWHSWGIFPVFKAHFNEYWWSMTMMALEN